MNITNADEEQTLGCIHGKESLLISPIIYWTEQDVWEFLNDVVRVPHCSLYDEGWHRIGCIGCPMSSHKQKMIENKRYPHVKRGWIKAIKAIRNGGYSKENISGGTSARTGCLSETSEDCSGRRRLHQASRLGTLDPARFYKQSDWIQKQKQEAKHGNMVSCNARVSSSSSSDRLTEEQENEIAENIYDWWISGKSYKQWYAERFQQLKIDFGDES